MNDDICAHIQRLEREKRRFKRLGVVSLILLAAVMFMGKANAPRTISAATIKAQQD